MAFTIYLTLNLAHNYVKDAYHWELYFQGRALGLAINFVKRPKFCHAYMKLLTIYCDETFNCSCLTPNTCTMHCMAALYVAPIYVPCISYINLIQYTCMHLE